MSSKKLLDSSPQIPISCHLERKIQNEMFHLISFSCSANPFIWDPMKKEMMNVYMRLPREL